MLERIHYEGEILSDEDKPPSMDIIEHVRQKPDMCGAACAEMLIRFYGITNIPQEDISFKYGVFKEGWGSPPDRIEAFFKELFSEAGIKEDMTLKELSDHLEAGVPAVALIQQIFPEKGVPHADLNEKVGKLEDGHYVNVLDVEIGKTSEESWVLVADPSNSDRQYDEEGYVVTKVDPEKPYEFRPIYKIKGDVFEKIWYDALEDGRVAKGLIIWFDPLSIKVPPQKVA